MSSSEPRAFYASSPVQMVDTARARIPVRRFGTGEPLLLIHGWPLSGFTYRKILPALAEKYTCYTVDLAGAGDSEWQPDNDFSFHGHAENLKTVVEVLGLSSYRLLAHDTGATVARRLAIIDPEKVRALVLIDTEIPYHRPPLVPFMQKLLKVPGSTTALRWLMRSKTYVRSSMGFGGCFVDLSLIDGDFHDAFVTPLITSARRARGQILYALGIDWAQLDGLRTGHREIKAPVLLLWGDQDPFFPVADARAMVPQFRDCRDFVVIENTKLLPHEERPDEVLRHVLKFFSDVGA